MQGLDLQLKSLNESRSKAKKRIETLERELSNCAQEIDYLQDQLGSRNAEVFSLGKLVDELELKLTKMEDMEVKVDQLSDELKRSNAENLLLIEELQSKDLELQCSELHIKRLEESICSVTLDSQCEIEGMRLNMMTLEQGCFESRKAQEDAIQENASLNKLIKELEIQCEEKPDVSLERENKELRDKLRASEICAQEFIRMIDKGLKNKSYMMESRAIVSREVSACGDVLGELFSKLPMALVTEVDSKEQLDNMSCQIANYESTVRKLKEELKEVKLKANEEAEDLAQEMAELRYETTCLLEEERKRRAMVELASTQRIAELESQIREVQMESAAVASRTNLIKL
ncbi:hypothetical protein LINPERHAP1_LOCUS20711 [Linum perenne]